MYSAKGRTLASSIFLATKGSHERSGQWAVSRHLGTFVFLIKGKDATGLRSCLTHRHNVWSYSSQMAAMMQQMWA